MMMTDAFDTLPRFATADLIRSRHESRSSAARQWWRTLAAMALAMALSVSSLHAAAQERYDLDRTKKSLTELIERTMKQGGHPSISVALVKDDAIVWKAAFGYANLRTRTPATPQTLYSTGSTFKSVTATAIMQLAEQGKLQLNQTVNSHLSNVHVQDRLQGWKPVTIEHILSHWSGLVGGQQTKPIWGRELPKTLEQLVAQLYSIRAPEEKYEYNNAAYGLAGLLVQDVSGVEYEQYMVEHVLKPLGINTPHPAYPSPEMVELMALPYVPGGEGQSPKPTAQVHYDVYPAGDIYLTAEDMARYLGAHLNGGVFNGQRILSEASVKNMHTPRFGGDYGFGFRISKDAKGHTLIAHDGGIPGFTSTLIGDVDARAGVYFMTNYYEVVPKEVAFAALQLLSGETYEVPPPPAKK